MGQSEQSVLRWSPETGGSLRLSVVAVVAPRGDRDAAVWSR